MAAITAHFPPRLTCGASPPPKSWLGPCRPGRRAIGPHGGTMSSSDAWPDGAVCPGGKVWASSSAVGMRRSCASAGSWAVMAAMILSVSARKSGSGQTGTRRADAHPDGGRVQHVGHVWDASERGHTCSVPHTPNGMTGAPVAAAKRAAPVLPRRRGSKNASPPRDRPLGRDDQHLAVAQTPPPPAGRRRGQTACGRRRWRQTLASGCRPPGHRTTPSWPAPAGCDRPRTRPGHRRWDRSSCDDWRPRWPAPTRDVLRAGDVEAGERDRRLLEQEPHHIHGLGAEQLGRPAGLSRWTTGQRRRMATGVQSESGLTAVA